MFEVEIGRSRQQQALSPLETHIIKLLAEGLHTKEIAASVNRSAPTVESYIRLLYAKFSARSRAHLVVRAIACNVIAIRFPPSGRLGRAEAGNRL